MLIGELSKKTGFSQDTIRFYEKRGLIDTRENDRRENNYKEYSQAICDKLLFVKAVKAMGFTLREADQFITAWGEPTASCGNLSYHLTDKLTQIDEQIAQLLAARNRITGSLEKCKSEACEFAGKSQPEAKSRPII